MKILLSRVDRIGDTVLSIPAAEAIKKIHPEFHVSFLTRAYTADLFHNNPHIDELIIDKDDVLKKGGSISGFFKLLREIRDRDFDMIFILHPELRLNLLAYFSGIKKRVTPASKIYQFLCNYRIRQKRSLCQLHEADYNLHLVRSVFKELPRVMPKLYPDAEIIENIRHLKKNRKFIIIHPGSGGSARNYPLKYYLRIAKDLMKQDMDLFLSYGPGEEHIRDYFLENCSENILFLPVPPDLKELIALLSISDLLITSSTGPLHIGTAVKTKTVSFFCPIQVCTPVRWGPFPQELAEVISPEGIPGCEKCIGEKCIYFDCMEKIDYDSVMKKIIKQLSV